MTTNNDEDKFKVKKYTDKDSNSIGIEVHFRSYHFVKAMDITEENQKTIDWLEGEFKSIADVVNGGLNDIRAELQDEEE